MLSIEKIDWNVRFLKKMIMRIWLFSVIVEMVAFPSLATLYALSLCSIGLFSHCKRLITNKKTQKKNRLSQYVLNIHLNSH